MIVLDAELAPYAHDYDNLYKTLQARESHFPLIAQRTIYVHAGCTAVIPHGLKVVSMDGVRAYIMAHKPQMTADGILVEVHPVVVGEVLATSIFNTAGKDIRILAHTVISELVVLDSTPTKWKLQ